MIFSRQSTPRRAIRLVTLLVVGMAIVALGLAGASPVSAHAELMKSDPPADSLLAAPPRHLTLTFSEAVAVSGAYPSISLLRSNGTKIVPEDVRRDPSNHSVVDATFPALSPDTYTISWTVRSQDDGHITTGTFAFSFGSVRAPGAATVAGQTPQIWSVATRWLTFLGAALAAGGFLFALFLAPDLDAAGEIAHRVNRRRALAMLIGAAVAWLATILEPFFATIWPPANTEAPSLGDAIRGFPSAWWLRPTCLLIVIVIAAVVLALVTRRRQLPRPVELLGLIIALVALLGLSLTGHAAARTDTWRSAGIVADTLHQWSTALWVGGLAQLAITWSWPLRPVAKWPDPVRRFSFLALGLVVVAGLSGVANAALILPKVRSLWSSDYGYVLIGKTAILVPVLLLATFHRTALRRLAAWTGQKLRATVRLEAALVLLVVLGGSTLATLAPPQIKASDLTFIDIAEPAGGTSPLYPEYTVRLQVGPAEAGSNTINVKVTTPDAKPVPTNRFSLVRLDFTSLTHGISRDNLEAKPAADGLFHLSGVELSLKDWWRVQVTLRQLGKPDLTVPFYLMLPDPNVNGMTAPKTPASNETAEAVFARGLKTLTALHSVEYTQRLAGGTGTEVTGNYAVTDGTTGGQPGTSIFTNNYVDIMVGGKDYVGQPGQPWTISQAPPLLLPNQWGDNYTGATGFQLGLKETIDGELCQLVTFTVPPRDGYVQAWFGWWVGEQTGHIRQETMVSRYHYMINQFHDFDQPVIIQAPTAPLPGTPGA